MENPPRRSRTGKLAQRVHQQFEVTIEPTPVVIQPLAADPFLQVLAKALLSKMLKDAGDAAAAARVWED